MTQGFALPLSVTKLQLLKCTWLPCGGPGAGLAAAPIIPTQPCKTRESQQLRRLLPPPTWELLYNSPFSRSWERIEALGKVVISSCRGKTTDKTRDVFLMQRTRDGILLLCCKTTLPKR